MLEQQTSPSHSWMKLATRFRAADGSGGVVIRTSRYFAAARMGSRAGTNARLLAGLLAERMSPICRAWVAGGVTVGVGAGEAALA